MKLHVANPIYDTVFKYMMEDDRVAKIFLSALLKQQVIKVEMRRHEYTNGSRDAIAMFRIDFAATIRMGQGEEKLVLIELQKTWLETETLRFRQYLAVQYTNPENIPQENNEERYAVPMIAVYLLGHKLGEITDPVVYVKRKVYDYDDNEIIKGVPNPFVESLTHDSIIVQIPRLTMMRFNNGLDRVLSVFDQTRKDMENRHVLEIDDSIYGDDEDMKYLLRRLADAASDADLRRTMRVEDEYYSAIEHRDEAIANRDKRLAQQDAQLAQQDAQLAQQDARLAQQDAQIAQQDAQIAQLTRMLLSEGKTLDQIATTLGVTADELRKYLD